ncbi:MAG TPA: DUF433 domain-containing protein [Thermomicrobiales bacterium]|nr:DUF433 domain-containing protein [Thermomicrobiales bacterium]
MTNDAESQARITHIPEILQGKPIIRGTRVPVSLIADFVNNGVSPAQMVEDYPDFTVEDIEAAVAFAARERSRTEVRRW